MWKGIWPQLKYVIVQFIKLPPWLLSIIQVNTVNTRNTNNTVYTVYTLKCCKYSKCYAISYNCCGFSEYADYLLVASDTSSLALNSYSAYNLLARDQEYTRQTHKWINNAETVILPWPDLTPVSLEINLMAGWCLQRVLHHLSKFG